MKSLLKEPLVHFLGLAALLFLLNIALTNRKERLENTIFISAAEQERLVALFTTEAGRLPNSAEVRGMLTDYVRNEALAREARRLGLDADDVIIERRLSQKMMFTLTDMADETAVNDDDLRAWYEDNTDRFREPDLISFDHIFFRDADDPRIASVLDQVTGEADIDWRRLGDPFMLQRQYGDLPPREVVRIFGGEFSQSLFGVANVDVWQGPLSSALGTHLVRIKRYQPSRLPAFSDIRDKVLSEYQEVQLRQANAEAVDELVSAYRVELEGITD